MDWKYGLSGHSNMLNVVFRLWFVLLSFKSTEVYTDDIFPPSIDVSTASDGLLKERLRNYGVHYTEESIMRTLKEEYKGNEPISILMNKYEEIKKCTPSSLPETNKRHPIISIDGFFTHGRTMIAKKVARALNGRRVLLPSRHVARLRTYFTSSVAKKHYYSLSKYMGSNLAISYCRNTPVIIERYWHDQASFVISRTFDNLPPDNSTVYEFPKDLLKPDLMFFINGALNPRMHNDTTADFHQHNILSSKILEVSRRMRNPRLIEIGPSGLPMPLAQQVIATVRTVIYKFLPRPHHKPQWLE